MTANDRQVGGDHYKQAEVEPWDIVHMYNLDYYLGNALKYILRHEKKGKATDIDKAIHYLQKWLELHDDRPGSVPTFEQRLEAAQRFVGQDSTEKLPILTEEEQRDLWECRRNMANRVFIEFNKMMEDSVLKEIPSPLGNLIKERIDEAEKPAHYQLEEVQRRWVDQTMGARALENLHGRI
ncbi:DUF3310 domain-containing protein [Microcystis sp. M42BS1]|uniref:DUF3310 domain-containing protein n=1 Tax=Microcystis sp. M42BS1 TaxID=2771192 RepID=UPI002584E25F|nr:DUF3310 domain-containing protein [Microcystis sp. M42BS1]MCA2570654.1 DUF3310 domain-containing protein [Microcystis sp. M42BS1]